MCTVVGGSRMTSSTPWSKVMRGTDVLATDGVGVDEAVGGSVVYTVGAGVAVGSGKPGRTAAAGT
jgi:hypothetical protein